MEEEIEEIEVKSLIKPKKTNTKFKDFLWAYLKILINNFYDINYIKNFNNISNIII